MQGKFITAIEELSGRSVLAFISNHDVGPDVGHRNRTVLPTPDGHPDPAGQHA